MQDNEKFADLGQPKRIWAMAAIHGEVERLAAVHDDLAPRFRPGERLVYLGNYLGRGGRIRETIDELLAFRRGLLARRGMLANDIIYLRGSQEEMWQKLLLLQFAPNPSEVLTWMLRQGVDATLRAYGGSIAQGLASARDGAVSLTRWTNGLRAAMRSAPGHENLMSALRRAAFTSTPMPRATQDGAVDGHDFDPASNAPAALLLVNAGIDPTRPVAAQGDSFWWGAGGFARIAEGYGDFRRIVRGYDPAHEGVRIADFTASIDGGCGFGGRLVCACLSPTGDVLELIEA